MTRDYSPCPPSDAHSSIHHYDAHICHPRVHILSDEKRISISDHHPTSSQMRHFVTGGNKTHTEQLRTVDGHFDGVPSRHFDLGQRIRALQTRESTFSRSWLVMCIA